MRSVNSMNIVDKLEEFELIEAINICENSNSFKNLNDLCTKVLATIGNRMSYWVLLEQIQDLTIRIKTPKITIFRNKISYNKHVSTPSGACKFVPDLNEVYEFKVWMDKVKKDGDENGTYYMIQSYRYWANALYPHDYENRTKLLHFIEYYYPLIYI